MEYRFRLTWWESVWFIGKLTVEALMKTKFFPIFCGFYIAIGTLEQVINVIRGSGDGLLLSVGMVILPLVFFALLVSGIVSISLLVEYSARGFRNERLVGVHGGYLSIYMSTGKSWYPCNGIQATHVVGPLIWFGSKQTTKHNMYIVIPTRLFGSKEKRKEFLEYVGQQRQQNPTEIDVLWKEEGVHADWDVSFEVDEDVWVSVQTEAIEIKRQLHMRQACFYRIGEEEIRRRVRKVLIPDLLYGTWKVMGNAQGIYFQTPSVAEFVDWSGIHILAETDRFFHVYGKRHEWMLGSERANEINLTEICQKHGVHHRVVPSTTFHKGQPTMSNGKGRLLTVIIASGAILAIVMALKMGNTMSDLGNDLLPQVESETPYVFYSEGFPEYQPLEAQIEVLRSLDIQVPEEAVDSLKDWMEQWPEAREWVEGEPYTSLLIELGYPQYDEETWEVIDFSDQTYWFDLEGYEIGEDYVTLLNGIQALSGGQFFISEIECNMEYADMDHDRGFVQMNFLLNGKPCEYKAKVESYWLDRGIVSYVGRQLKKEHTSGRLYSMDDDGQGLILFFRTSEWANQFRERTGKSLFEEPVQ